nr:TadE/TadG family type IV pilus assembly protein [Sphingomonas hankyongi]
MRSVRQLAGCQRGASGVEFALVLPLLLILLLGTVDAGRFLWEVNRAEKATQMGARYAVVTSPVSTGLINADFESAGLSAGELIPADTIGKVECTRATCTCTDCDVTVGSGVDTTRFDAIVARMQAMDPAIEADKVKVTYRGSGFGFAGDSGGGGSETMEISPLVTVSLTDMEFRPITSLMLANIPLPAFSTTLTAEDASGAYSN